MAILDHKFGLADSVRQFVETRISLDSIVTVREYFGVVYGLDIDENETNEGELALLEIRDFPCANKLNSGLLTIYEELAMLYGSLLRLSEQHSYYPSHAEDLKVLAYGVMILSNVKDLELARKDLYASTYTGIQQKCLVNDANIKAKAASKIIAYYINLVLSYL